MQLARPLQPSEQAAIAAGNYIVAGNYAVEHLEWEPGSAPNKNCNRHIPIAYRKAVGEGLEWAVNGSLAQNRTPQVSHTPP